MSASWGGFQASAALADDGSATVQAGGPGLNSGASYGANGVQAGAGAYGQNAHAGLVNGDKKPAVVGGYVDQKPGSGGYGNGQLYHQNGAGAGNGFFDRIFAVSILSQNKSLPIVCRVKVSIAGIREKSVRKGA